jgi:hypothetical protein
MKQKLNLEGETVVMNLEEKRINMVIEEPFMTAGKLFKWDLGNPAGLGINNSIVNLVKKTHCYLCVYVATWGKTYFIKPDVLDAFIKNHQTEYRVGHSDKYIHVISVKYFTNTREN